MGIIVAFGMRADETKVALRQGKKKRPNCAEFVQPDAKTCRFCQHSFVEEEAAEQARLEAEKAKWEAENAERLATAARQQAEWKAAEAAKLWLERHAPLVVVSLILPSMLGMMLWYGMKYEPQQGRVPASENKPTVPTWVTEERSNAPNSVWDKKVAWAIQHHCYFFAMSRDEIVQALGQPTEEQSFDLTYKRQTNDCARYDGDVCTEYKTEQNIIFLKDGYTDPAYEHTTNGCRTSFGEHEYPGLTIPSFSTKTSRKPAPPRDAYSKKPSEAEAQSWQTQQGCENNGLVWYNNACHANQQ